MATDDTRTRILNAAGPVFAEKGFKAATIRDICEAAAVNVASVNYYFGDKEHLYVETLQQALPIEREALERWPEGTPAEERLRGFVIMFLRRLLAPGHDGWQMLLLIREVLKPTRACEVLVRDYFRSRFEFLLGILEELLPEGTPEHRRHQVALSIVAQCVHYRAANGVISLLISEDERRDFYQPEQLAEHIAGFSLAALGRGPSPFTARAGLQRENQEEAEGDHRGTAHTG